ncbi:MAG TPA: vanadium-dependent haloperoxidase [Vicinamibacterales bacterium]|nr:vanadium-dependent haloperoxidase [Vicinamibacterales bacterium]
MSVDCCCRLRTRLFTLWVIGLSVLTPALVRANVVDDWNAIAQQAIVVNAGRGGAVAVVDYAYVQVAVYDAVNAIDGRYSVFAVRPLSSPVGGSPEAAAATAAYLTLKWMFPAQQAYLDGVYASYMAGIPAGSPRTIGVIVGTEVANAFTASRAGDGRNASVGYVFGSGPGVYQLTPGCPAPPASPASPWLGQLKPFAIESPAQFRADGPPDLTSAQWADDLNETRLYGALNASLRTSEETRTGQFYAENPGSQFGRNVRGIATAYQLSVADSARFFAQVFVTTADSLITVFNSKYYYSFWRPLTAIRAADTDDNPNTDTDPAWLPLISTPCHPEYPAAHGAGTGGLAHALEQFFSTKRVEFTLTSTSVPGFATYSHHFTKTQDLVKEVIDARIFGGMHYRTSGVHGTVIGDKVAHYVAKHFFQPVE